MRVIACPSNRASCELRRQRTSTNIVRTAVSLGLHCVKCNLPVKANKLAKHDCIKELKSALQTMFFPIAEAELLQLYGYLWMDDKESRLFLHIVCQTTSRSGRRELPELPKRGTQGPRNWHFQAGSRESARFRVCSKWTPITNRRCSIGSRR